MSTQTFRVSGMTCDHCVAAVSDEIGAIDGVTGVSVVLDPAEASTVTVHANQPVADQAVAAAVDEAGYAMAAT